MSQIPASSFLDEDSFFSEMVSSQSGLGDQITRLKEVVDCTISTEDKIRELLNFLSNNNLQNATIDILDEKIFSVALNCARKVYFEIIQTLNETLKNEKKNLDNVKKQLKFLSEIVTCWNLCINHTKTLEKISVIDVKSLPESLFEVIINALIHCKNSAENYQDLFTSVSDLLTSFFRQCISIMNSFYLILDSVISFDLSKEDEMNILFEIIDKTGKLATLVCNMESKTLTDMWKRFGKLSTVYVMEIKDFSSDKITCHFDELAKNIVSILSTINKNNQRTTNERAVFCCRVLIKILEKLCDTYCGWIRNDAMLGIINMLTESYRYINVNLKLEGYNAEFIKFVESNFSIVMEPFLDIVFKNESFKMAFFEYGKTEIENVVGYHFLLLTIIKKISMLSYETQREWCTKETSILDTCFESIDKLTTEICVGKVQFQISRDVVQGSNLKCIYEATCLNIFSLVCQISNEDFSDLEILLLKHLLSGKFYASLLSSDTWCFICRLGTSEMCYSHFCYLMQAYEALKSHKYSLNTIILSNLLRRQYMFLADKDKSDFKNSFKKSSDPHIWRLISTAMDPDKKKKLQQQIDGFTVIEQISHDLKSVEEVPSPENFYLLINHLIIVETCSIPQNQKYRDIFLTMWNKIVNIIADCEGPPLLLLEDLVIALLGSTYFEQGQSKYMTSILELIVSLYPYASISLRLEICYFFKRWSSQLTSADSSLVAETFSRLLSDEDPCVMQQGFECFEYLTQSCPDANLLSFVATSIRNAQTDVSKTLPAYISNQLVHRLIGFSTSVNFFEEITRLISKRKSRWLERKVHVWREEKLARMDSEENENEDVEMRAEKICEDLEYVEKMSELLKKDTWEKLRKVCQRVLDRRC